MVQFRLFLAGAMIAAIEAVLTDIGGAGEDLMDGSLAPSPAVAGCGCRVR
jgi:hypothetical protein